MESYMDKVTLWYKIIKNEKGDHIGVKYNHLEDGWSEEEKPQPKHKSFTNQKAWAKEDWQKKWCHLVEGYYVLKGAGNN